MDSHSVRNLISVKQHLMQSVAHVNAALIAGASKETLYHALESAKVYTQEVVPVLEAELKKLGHVVL